MNLESDELRNSDYNLINRYIDCISNDVKDFYQAVYILKKIDIFLKYYKIEKSALDKILKENINFKSLLNIIIISINNCNELEQNIEEDLYLYIDLYRINNKLNLDNRSYESDIVAVDSLTDYFNEIRGYPILTSEEEIELAKRIENGDKKAYEFFVKCNLKLVVEIASKFAYKNKVLSFQDLIQEGNLGLLKAVLRFDYKLGYKFSTYATWWIKDSIVCAMREKGRNIRVPKTEIRKISAYRKLKDGYLEKYGRNPTILEVASIMNISEEVAAKIAIFEFDVVSLNGVCEDSKNEYINALYSPDDLVDEIYEEKEKKEFIRKVLDNSGLTEREIGIIKKYFGIGCKRENTYKIASEYSLSKSRVNQVLSDALKKLRKLNSLSIYSENAGYLDNKEMNLNNFLVFLNQSKMSLTSDIQNQSYLIQILLKSEFAKKEIDFFILHYGFKLSLNEISLKYKDKFTSQSGKDSLRVIRNISISVNSKIKKSKYINEINEYIYDSEKIINEFSDGKQLDKRI